MKRTSSPLFALALLTSITIPVGAQSIYTPYQFSNFAGIAGGIGNNDGIGTQSRFSNPIDVKADAAGNLYVADAFNLTVRKLTPVGGTWVATTLAGSPRNSGIADGTGSVARFVSPQGVAADSAGNAYVSDWGAYTIRQVTPAGVVTTIAGTALSSGSRDDTNGAARFYHPTAVAVDSATNIYVSDSGNYTIRKITPIGTNWVVTTIAGTAGQSGYYNGTNGTIEFGGGPPGLAVDSVGNLYVADSGNEVIRKITLVGTNWVASTIAGTPGSGGFNDGTNGTAGFYNPYGITVDNNGNLFVDDGDNLVRKITPIGTNWVVTTLAGNTAFGSQDGVSTNAEFNGLGGMTVDSLGNLYVADQNNNTIRKIALNATVTTIAGTPTHRGTNDGVGNSAQFYLPFGAALDTASNVYIGDQGNNTIRRITPDGLVTTLAGDASISSGGGVDGTNANAEFRQPSCLAVDAGTNIYVADAGNYKIRRVSPVGTNWSVVTIAGGTLNGSRDGTNKTAEFNFCYGIAIDAFTNLYVADTYNDQIRRVSPVGTNWVVTTLAGKAATAGAQDGTNKNALFNYPYGVAVDAQTNIYVADYNNMAIRKVSPVGTNWVTTTIAGTLTVFGSADGTNNEARFLYPQGITIDSAGNLFVSDGGNATIRRIVHSGTNWIVTTLGGAPRPGDGVGQAGAVDGIGSAARLNNPWGLAVDPAGNLFIPDSGENRIIEASPRLLFDPASTSMKNGVFSFRLTGTANSNAVVEASIDLLNWSAIQTNNLGAIGASNSVSSPSPSAFLRARLTP